MIWTNLELITDTTQAFVYLITLEKDGEEKYYIGCKSLIPGWKQYISSSDYVKADKEFITRKIILEVFDDKTKGQDKESFLIKKFNAVKSDKFYNRNDSGQKFNTTGVPKTEKQKQALYKIGTNPQNIERLRKIASSDNFKGFIQQLFDKYRTSPVRLVPLTNYLNSEKHKHHLSFLNTDPFYIDRRNKMNSSSEHLEHLKNQRETEKFKDGLDKHRNSELNKEHLSRIRNSDLCIFKNQLRANSEDNKEFLRGLLKTEKCKEGFANYKMQDISKEIDRQNLQKAHLINQKKVKCSLTGRIFESITDAQQQLGIPQPTIGRHCRNEVKTPKWSFI